MTRWLRDALDVLHFLAGYVPCPALHCGRWARYCAACQRRRYSPWLYRVRW